MGSSGVGLVGRQRRKRGFEIGGLIGGCIGLWWEGYGGSPYCWVEQITTFVSD